jgi:biotin carboxylase
MLARLVAALDLHGALSMDLVVADRGPVIIDVNPRLVEPANALAAGVDLVAAMLTLRATHRHRSGRRAARAFARARRRSRSWGPPNSAAREVLSFAERSMPFSREAIMLARPRN